MFLNRILGILLIFIIVSCKKDIHCNCKTTISSDDGTTKSYYTYVTVNHSTENQAKKGKCQDYNIKTEPTRYYDEQGNRDTIYQTTTNFKCDLK